MLMHNPPHPGEVLKRLCLEPLRLSVAQAAKALGVSRKTLSAILNGRAGISPGLEKGVGSRFLMMSNARPYQYPHRIGMLKGL